MGGHGGMDYYDFGLCEGLFKAGIDITLYTSDETPNRDALYRVRLPYRRIYGESPAWLRGLRFVRGSVSALLGAKVRGTEVVHFHFFHIGPLELFNFTLARLLKMKVVATAHDVQSFVERLSVPWMARRVYRGSDRIIAHSEVSRSELRRILKVPEARIDAIPHGNYLSFIGRVPTQEEARDRIGVPREARVLLFFGQIKAVKGLDVLLQAMPLILEKHPSTVLLVAGKVWKDDFRRYAEQVDALGIADNCILRVGFVPDHEVPSYYAAADAVVLPYRKIYQSGVLLMAMSYAKPVVVSDVAGMTEVISDGDTGYIFGDGDARSLADRVVEGLSDTERLRRVGQRGLTYVRKHHDWGEIGQLTAACYRSTLCGGKARTHVDHPTNKSV